MGEKINREIKFRGIRIDDGKWIYGSLIKDSEFHYRIVVVSDTEPYDWFAVVPESIGQSTGLKDKAGIDIYEGDILKTETNKPMVVGWSERFASFVLNKDGWAFSHWFGESCDTKDCEVIGNIYQHPDLLK